MTFFFDNCISPHLADLIERYRSGIRVIPLRREFPARATDIDWLQKAVIHRWIIVCGDHRILRNPLTRYQLEKGDLVAYFPFRSYLRTTGWEQLRWMVQYWERIESHARSASDRGALHIVDQRGVIRLLDGR